MRSVQSAAPRQVADRSQGPGISVKLSALHPRYEPLQAQRCVPALIATLTALALAAKAANIGLTVDAEEADRLEISLDVFAAVLADPRLAGWDGLGLAVQAYQKRAIAVIDWVAALARQVRHRVPTRLVKGAYWDSEIKLAQVQGHADYPVFTRKAATDVSWLACARRMLECRDALYPAFATHNAHSLAFVLACAARPANRPGTMISRCSACTAWARRCTTTPPTRCASMRRSAHTRICSPIWCGGCWRTAPIPVSCIAWSIRRCPKRRSSPIPWRRMRALGVSGNPRIPLPRDLYPDRRNSAGVDLADRATAPALLAAIHRHADRTRSTRRRAAQSAIPPIAACWSVPSTMRGRPEIDAELDVLARGWREWDAAGGAHRAEVLERAADLIEASRDELLFLLAREGGKTLPDGIAEIREAADYCRWYALCARRDFAEPRELPGPTGERNTWALGGRGVFAAISPWNFPLAIFTGQVAAALAAGNAVAAKPAEQTPLVAARAVALLLEAGVPRTVLALLPGDGTVGQALVHDERIAGVAFTGGTETARRSRDRWPRGPGRSFRSSPRPAASTR